jgi:hypothetical protein
VPLAFASFTLISRTNMTQISDTRKASESNCDVVVSREILRGVYVKESCVTDLFAA